MCIFFLSITFSLAFEYGIYSLLQESKRIANRHTQPVCKNIKSENSIKNKCATKQAVKECVRGREES